MIRKHMKEIDECKTKKRKIKKSKIDAVKYNSSELISDLKIPKIIITDEFCEYYD